jgi:hypothetical protein
MVPASPAGDVFDGADDGLDEASEAVGAADEEEGVEDAEALEPRASPSWRT